jgi:hypothetical protein
LKTITSLNYLILSSLLGPPVSTGTFYPKKKKNPNKQLIFTVSDAILSTLYKITHLRLAAGCSHL